MNSSSEIKICGEDRKNIDSSLLSSSYINKRVTKANTVLIKSSNVERQEQQLNEFIQPRSSSFINSITTETVNHLNQHQTNIQHRPRIHWSKHRTSLHSKNKHPSIILPSSSMETNIKQQILNPLSITEILTKDVDNEYQRYVDQVTSMNPIIDDDHEKVFINQASQANLMDRNAKTRMKSSNPHRKIQSALVTSLQTDITSTPFPSSTTKLDDNNFGKSPIIVDTSKARSNIGVVRICIRELGWKEVIHRYYLIKLSNDLFHSVHFLKLLILISIGIHHHSMKVI
jgi:hypothetical protein